jgi:hypothetical protein
MLRITEPLESVTLLAEAGGRPLVLNHNHSIETAMRNVKGPVRIIVKVAAAPAGAAPATSRGVGGEEPTATR